MKEFINSVLPIPVPYQLIIGSLATFILACIGHSGRSYLKASEEFRNVVYVKLEGVYPNTAAYISVEEKNSRTQTSINPINSAGAKFRYYLPRFCIRCFDRALVNYCETARHTNWEHDGNFEMFRKSMAKPGELSPGEKFRYSVKNLLKFAK